MPLDGSARRALGVADLNADQTKAMGEIEAAIAAQRTHLVRGRAGTGKTTLMQALAMTLKQRRMSVVLTAPTHKAVSVLRKKLKRAGINVECQTIQSLLGLTPKPRADRLVFERRRDADPVTADVVVCDECSMIGDELLGHIQRYLPVSTVLFVGDDAQLPPVGEVASKTFQTRSESVLRQIVRQAEGNPIIMAARTIADSQGGPIDWSWCKQVKAGNVGVFCPRDAEAWMKRGFLSKEFAEDADAFRCAAWTNRRVAEINARVRSWIYGDNIPFPFMPGERAVMGAPLVRDKTILLNTNEEIVVEDIAAGTYARKFGAMEEAPAWTVRIPTWDARIRQEDGLTFDVKMVRDAGLYNSALDRLRREAKDARARWGEFHTFKSSFAHAEPLYAMTVHGSQGSTFGYCFVDVPDIRRRAESNLLEAQQLLYVAATRASRGLVLVGLS